MSVHERLARLLVAKGWSQRQAGEEFGCSQAMVSDLCLGRRKAGLSIAHAIERKSTEWPGPNSEPPIRTEEWDQGLSAQSEREG